MLLCVLLTTRLEMQSKTAGILEVISLIEITKTHASQQVHFVGKLNLFS